MKKTIYISVLIVSIFSCGIPINDEEPNFENYRKEIYLDNYLYQVENACLITYDLSDPTNINKIDVIHYSQNVALFNTFGELLFINFDNQIKAYKIEENGIPKLLNNISLANFSEEQNHCDPTIMNGNIAYVALPYTPNNYDDVYCYRNDTINQLRVYDITEIDSPIPIDTVQLKNPVAIAHDNMLLFVADSSEGLLIFDTTTPSELSLVGKFDEGISNVIISEGQLITVSMKRLVLYDYSDINDIQEVSKIDL